MANSKLRHYFFNIFLGLYIGSDKFRLLVSTHIQKMITSGEVTFLPLIAEMQLEGDKLNAILDRKNINYVGRHTETNVKDESVLELNKYVNYLHDFASAKFRNSPEKVVEIFPQGITFYTEVHRAEFASRLSFLDSKITKYAIDLTAPVVAEFAQHKLAIETTMELQQIFKDELGINVTDYARQRVKICKLLHKDALLITAFHYEEPKLVENYYDQTIWASHSHTDENMFDFNVNTLSVLDTEFSFIESTIFELTNKSAIDGGFFSSPVPVTTIPTTYEPFPAGSTLTKTGAEMLAPANKYFYLVNPSTVELLLVGIKITQ